MGYTHYWKHTEFTVDQWNRVKLDVAKILKTTDVDLRSESDENTPPEITDNHIRFNGVEDDGHETFYIDRNAAGFEFCKTARKPYDTVVIAVLSVLTDINPSFSWSSDGHAEDHVEGINLYRKALRV